jgi:trehalose 6-phosphate synthase
MDHLELLYKPAALLPEESKGRLVVVSDRVPTTSAAPAAGGLAVALEAALKPRGGWFGWSGEACKESEPVLQVTTNGSGSFAVSGLSRRDIEQYYCGFANRALWPICHYRLDLADLSECNAAAYFRCDRIRILFDFEKTFSNPVHGLNSTESQNRGRFASGTNLVTW